MVRNTINIKEIWEREVKGESAASMKLSSNAKERYLLYLEEVTKLVLEDALLIAKRSGRKVISEEDIGRAISTVLNCKGD